MTIVRLRSLSKRYGDVAAVAAVDLAVGAGVALPVGWTVLFGSLATRPYRRSAAVR